MAMNAELHMAERMYPQNIVGYHIELVQNLELELMHSKSAFWTARDFVQKERQRNLLNGQMIMIPMCCGFTTFTGIILI